MLKNFKIAQKLSFAFGIVIIFVLSLLGYIYVNFNEQSKALDSNIQSYNIIRKSDQILISFINMETGTRGYAFTGMDKFLEPFNEGKSEVYTQIGELSNLTRNNPLQQSRISSLRNYLDSWMRYQSTYIVEGRDKVNEGTILLDDLVKEAQKGIGKGYMDSMRVSLGDITTEEEGILQGRKDNLNSIESITLLVISIGAVFVVILSVIIGFLLARMVIEPVKTVTNTFREISEGDVDLDVRLDIHSKDEIGYMAKYFNGFMHRLTEIIAENKEQSWIKSGKTGLNDNINGESDIVILADKIINYLSKYIDANIGAIYIRVAEDRFKLLGSYAYKKHKSIPNVVKLGEGIVGQAALEKQRMVVSNIPEEYIYINTGLGEAAPKNILVVPCINNNEVICVIELGAFHEFSDTQIKFVEEASSGIAVSVNAADAQSKMKELLATTLEQSEELQTQQEELRQNNEELEDQTKALRESEAYMQSQQEELRVLNEELEERTKRLELQKKDIVAKNKSLIKAQKEIEKKADALELASKYKSEFLANMSHELRTPLNSIIVLSQMLAENKESSDLSEKQLEFAKTINSSGEDLLKLINDVLDISKVEAGKLDINLESLDLGDLIRYVKQTFTPIADKKDLYFNIEIDDKLDLEIIGDFQRLQQITNNLLSNAFKFTHSGGVTLSLTSSRIKKDDEYNRYIDITVKDTGIGIPENKIDVIFEPFRQSDGSTSRKYGGTGLGLSISRELARLMKGEISIKSFEGKGSTFTLTFPTKKKEINKEIKTFVEKKETTKSNHNDDRVSITENDKVLLIIEDDSNFSNILSDLAKEKGYKCIISESGEEGVSLAIKYNPDGILLDIGLPDINGWKVVEKLKNNEKTKNIPVHIISGSDESKVLKTEGIAGYLEKPVNFRKLQDVFFNLESEISHKFKKLLIVEIEENSQIEKIMKDQDILITTLNSGRKTIELLQNEEFDCMILDYELKDINSIDLLKELSKKELIKFPIIIYTGKQLTREDEEELHKYSESIIIKGTRSSDRLIAEANLFLHDVDSKIEKFRIDEIKSDIEKEDSFKDKKILIVDDDMRNVFALTSALEEKGLKVVVGRNGKEGIKRLKEDGNIDLILMDIMMPEMDGYTAIKEIRKDSDFLKTPIIALTAKAMKEDKQKCIEAGADDYLTKPIDIPRLISLLRVWLYK